MGYRLKLNDGTMMNFKVYRGAYSYIYVSSFYANISVYLVSLANELYSYLHRFLPSFFIAPLDG